MNEPPQSTAAPSGLDDFTLVNDEAKRSIGPTGGHVRRRRSKAAGILLVAAAIVGIATIVARGRKAPSARVADGVQTHRADITAGMEETARPNRVDAPSFTDAAYDAPPLKDAPLQSATPNERRRDKSRRYAIACVKRGDYERAVSEFTILINHDPTSATLYHWRAIAYKRLGQYQSALEDLNKSIALEPTMPRAFQARAVVNHELKNISAALLDIYSAIDLAPDRQEYREYARQLEDIKENMSGAK